MEVAGGAVELLDRGDPPTPAERVGDDDLVDPAQRADREVESDDEEVVAVQQREVGQQQPVEILAPGVDRAEADRGVLELPVARRRHPAVGGRGGQRGTQERRRVVVEAVGHQRRRRGADVERRPVQRAAGVLGCGEDELVAVDDA